MKAHEVIVKPLLTEKGTAGMEEHNDYPFQVNNKSNKVQIAQAIRKLFNVRVTGVRTMNMPGKRRRRGNTYKSTSGWKKAIIRLHPDDHLDVL